MTTPDWLIPDLTPAEAADFAATLGADHPTAVRRAGPTDELVAAFILADFMDENRGAAPTSQPYAHLIGCPDAKVTDPDMSAGSYGCATGCEHATLTATIDCGHARVEHTYGTFGDLSDLIEEIEAFAKV